MHEGGEPRWRKIVEKHRERLIEELAAEIGAEHVRALEIAVAAERESAKAQLDAERESVRLQVESERESARLRLEAERESARLQLESERESTKRALENTRIELDRAIQNARTAARQATAESLNQGVRRIRQADSDTLVLELLAELAGAYGARAVVLAFEKHHANVVAVRGIPVQAGTTSNGNGAQPAPRVTGVAIENAPALASAIETGDPVTVLARESEVSSVLAHLLSVGPADKMYLFPVRARHEVVAMLAVAGDVFSPALELLAEASGIRLESIAMAVKHGPVDNLVSIQKTAVPASAISDRQAWGELSAEDQRLHLQAQRMARVRVAKMRLEREDAWRRGLAESDVYAALRRDIESARTEFLQTFLSKSSTMVDYLHLEILRSLANEDDRVLGREYPGPMV